jgi:hypothetical protein
MIAAAFTFAILCGSLADAIAWAILHRRIRRQRETWPPRRVVARVGTIEETF